MAARTVADPVSSRLDRGERLGDDDDAGQHRRTPGDPGAHIATIPAKIHRGPRCDAAGGTDRPLVTAGRQPCRFARGVDAAHLQRHCGDGRAAQQQHRDQRRDRQRGLDGAEATVAYTPVFSARLMIAVSALTIESPVTTL